MNILESMDCLLALDLYFGYKGTENSIALSFERAGGLDSIEDVQKHPNYKVYEMANKLLNDYFELENDQMNGTGDSGAGAGAQPFNGFNI